MKKSPAEQMRSYVKVLEEAQTVTPVMEIGAIGKAIAGLGALGAVGGTAHTALEPQTSRAEPTALFQPSHKKQVVAWLSSLPTEDWQKVLDNPELRSPSEYVLRKMREQFMDEDRALTLYVNAVKQFLGKH